MCSVMSSARVYISQDKEMIIYGRVENVAVKL